MKRIIDILARPVGRVEVSSAADFPQLAGVDGLAGRFTVRWPRCPVVVTLASSEARWPADLTLTMTTDELTALRDAADAALGRGDLR